jgi:AAA+ superfamily predicted ATPase
MTRSEDDPLLASLLAAVSAAPGDIPLRLHVAGLLLDRGRPAEALDHCSTVLRSDPTHSEALALLRRASAELGGASRRTGRRVRADRPVTDPPGVRPFDWDAAEAQVRDMVEPAPDLAETLARPPDPIGDGDVDGVVFTDLSLADVGGMADVKARIERAIAPLRNPGLARTFGKRISGGLLLYGPPGCGKTYLARAIAGELKANFYLVGRSDVLDWTAPTGGPVPASERRLQAVFATARRNAPCVLFLDDVDAIGPKRSCLQNPSDLRAVVNQLLFELDSVTKGGQGVVVIAASSRPWDLDPALRRSGRLDRMILVAPPDQGAREAILRYHLRDRPLLDLDLDALVSATDGYSSADLERVAEAAADAALADSLELGQARPIGNADLDAAVSEVRPSVEAWLEIARAAATSADSAFEDLFAYLRQRRPS